TTDRGTTWKVLSPDLTRNEKDWKKASLGDGIPLRDSTTPSRDDGTGLYGNITTISESPRAAGTIYIGTDDGNVQMTTDGGAHWTNLTPRFHLRAPRWVSVVRASQFDAKTAYVTFDGHYDDDLAPYVFKTSDGGATWTSIAGNLPAGAPVKTLTEDPRNRDVLFAGTEFGLYWTFDGGRHWQFPGGALPRVMVDRILLDDSTSDLILGTYGRSVVILDDIEALEDSAMAKQRARLFPMRTATEYYQWRDQPLAGLRQFLAPNTPVGALITYRLTDSATKRDSTVRIEIANAAGNTVRELSGPGTPGLHRVLWDLHTQYAFAPAPDDSGFYGSPRAPYVTPGDYTVRLLANGTTLTQSVHVRRDRAAATTPDALRAREDMSAAIDSLTRAFRDGKKALTEVDTEVARAKALVGHHAGSPADSVVKHVSTLLAAVHRGFGESYGTTIGNAYDLLGGLEASSAMPTESEQRTLDESKRHLIATIGKLNDIITTELPKLRAAIAQLQVPTVTPVAPPR